MDLHVFFQHEVKPALGCTEPGAVAYAAGVAASHMAGPPRHIHLRLSANIYKNGTSVGIPGTDGLKGNLFAAALGALGGDPDRGLQSLEHLTPESIARARAMLEAVQVTQEVVGEVPSVYAEVELLREGESVTAILAHRHDNIVEIRRNGRTVPVAPDEGDDAAQGQLTGVPAYLRELGRTPFAELWADAGRIDADLEAFLLEGAAMNLAVAEAGLAEPWGLGVGHCLHEQFGKESLLMRVKAHTAAAADVRMAGGTMPVMSSAGSGNHGLTAIIPPAVAAREWGPPPRELAEALALSHLVTGAVKAGTGRLTPVCGCTVAAGSGAAAALVRLSGGNARQAESAVAYVISSLMGMLCDGAKASCALKVSTAAGEALTAATLALHGGILESREGVVGPDFLGNTAAVGEISGIGFSAVDATILRLLDDAGR